MHVIPRKLFFAYQQLLINWSKDLAEGNKDVVNKIRCTDRHYISLLMKPECRVKKRYFMIDYDDKKYLSNFLEVLKEKEIEIEIVKETKNGFHIKTKPFNRTLLHNEKDKWEIKTDANFFVEYIK